MSIKDTLNTIITDYLEMSLPTIWERDLVIPLDTQKIITLTGVRRSGKTYHLFKVLKDYLKQGKERSYVLYINFEDERLQLKQDELDTILQAYRELFPTHEWADVVFLFDEIQVIEGWEKFVNRIYNTITKNIYITGSNSTFLSKDIATSLRGRTLTYEVFPLSFYEFVAIQDSKLEPLGSKGKTLLYSLFDQYWNQGGFPELLKMQKSLHVNILQNYYSTMLFRDLVERYHVSQIAIIKYFCKRIIGNCSLEFSVNKIFLELKSQGYKVSKNTLYEFQSFTESIYLERQLLKYSESVVKAELSQKKTYTIDHGLASALDFKFSNDKGRILECIVFLDLIKHQYDIRYWKESTECDFLLLSMEQVFSCIQVCVDISTPDTLKREINGVVNACKQFSLKEGYIITLNESKEIHERGINIHCIPACVFLYTTIYNLKHF